MKKYGRQVAAKGMVRLMRPPKWKTAPRALVLVLLLSGLLAGGLVPAFDPGQPRVAGAADGTGQTDVFHDLSVDPTRLILEVYGLLRSNSIKAPEPGQLVASAIQGMITGLRDYYAAYYTPAEMADFTSSVQGTFGGIGVVVSEDEEGNLMVANVMPGYPADKAGMKAGDVIVAVDGEDITGRGLPAASKIRGEVGTKVVLTVRREGVAEPLTFEMVRETIFLTSVDSRMLDGQVGYIVVTSFDQDTDKEFDQALQSLVASGAKAFVIDLRNNPGGLLDTCERMVERFLPRRYPYLRIQWTWRTDIVKSRTEEDYAPLEGVSYTEDGRFPYPVAILTNGYTASASEIFTAALQEWGVARVFGEKTYGKGCVQTIYGLSDGGGVKITTATWRTGLGRDIDGQGVTPDEIISDPSSPANEPGFIPVSDRWVFGRGSQGSDVVNLQVRLNQLGYDAGPEDGVFAARTEQALKKFQAAVGLPQTGVTDKATVAALNKARLADHPAGRKAGGASGAGAGPGAGSGAGTSGSNPPPPKVTGDQVVDRAIQWLHGTLGAGRD